MPSPFKLTQIYQALTAKNPLLKKKLKLGTSEMPIPPKRDDVTTIEAINRFNKANPRVDTTNLKPLSVKQSDVKKPDEAMVQGVVSQPIRTVDPVQDSGNKIEEVLKAYGRYRGSRKGKRPMKFKNFFELYSTENFAEGGRAGYEDGGRTGFFKAGLVKQGPNTGKWSVPDFDPNNRNTVFFESEETANKAIADRKIKTSRYEKSRNILNDPKLKKEFLKYAMGKDVTGKMIRKKYGLSNEEFFEGGLRNIIDKDFKKFSEGGIKQKTIKNMVLLHNNKLSKDYITKGLIVPNDIIEKLGLNSSEAATATTRLSQHYGGFDFGFDELKNIRRNAKASNKLFEAMNKFAFGNPYRSSLYRTSLELIDAQLGNERGTFSSLKNKARKVLKTNGIKGFDINEIAGVTGTARTGVGEFSQFMDVMDSNLNQKEMASFQSAFSRARENIKNNPENFATQSKQINKLAADFERRYNVKLPRIRNAEDVKKYYSPKRLEELKNQGLDIKSASKKLGYTVQMPSGASTVKEFVDQSTPQAKKILQNIQSYSKLPQCKVGAADGGRIGFAYSDECVRDGLKEQKIEAQKGNKKAAQELVQVGKVATKAGLLRNLLGPGAILGEAVYEGAVMANKVLGGTPADIAWAESYLSYLDPRKYTPEGLDPLEMRREDMITREDFNDPDYAEGESKTIDGPNANILRSGFAAQDQVSAFNEAVSEKARGENANRFDIANRAAADVREQGRFVDQSKDIISSDAFQEATKQAQEYIQSQTGENMFPYNQLKQSIGKYESGEARDLRGEREKEMQALGGTYQDYKNPFTKDEYENFARKEGYLPSDKSYTDKYFTDAILNPMKFEQLMEKPGFLGASEKFASGGIASLTKTIPPESGPTPQGLPYVYNNVKKI